MPLLYIYSKVVYIRWIYILATCISAICGSNTNPIARGILLNDRSYELFDSELNISKMNDREYLTAKIKHFTVYVFFCPLRDLTDFLCMFVFVCTNEGCMHLYT